MLTAAFLHLAAGSICFSTSCSLTKTTSASAVGSWKRALALACVLMPSDSDLFGLHSCSMVAGLSYKDLPPMTITELPPDAAVPACHVPLSTVSPHKHPLCCSPPQQNTHWQQQRQAAKPPRIAGTQAAGSKAREQSGADDRAAKKALALAQRQKAVDRQQEQRRLQSLGERAALLERKRLQAVEDRLHQQRMEEQQRKAAMR